MSKFFKAFLLAFLAFPFAANAVTVASWGGAYTESQIKAYVDTYSDPSAIQFENYNGGLGEVRDKLKVETLHGMLLMYFLTKQLLVVMKVYSKTFQAYMVISHLLLMELV